MVVSLRTENAIRSGLLGGRLIWIAVLAPLLLLFLLRIAGLWVGYSAEDAVIPPGTVLDVRLDQTLSSETAEAGEAFQGHVIAARTTGGSTLDLAGARVTGRALVVRQGSGQDHPGYIRLALETIEPHGGRPISIEATTMSEPAGGGGPAAEMPSPVTAASGTAHDVVVSPDAILHFALLQPVWAAGGKQDGRSY